MVQQAVWETQQHRFRCSLAIVPDRELCLEAGSKAGEIDLRDRASCKRRSVGTGRSMAALQPIRSLAARTRRWTSSMTSWALAAGAHIAAASTSTIRAAIVRCESEITALGTSCLIKLMPFFICAVLSCKVSHFGR
jgi:hypothetical protein